MPKCNPNLGSLNPNCINLQLSNLELHSQKKNIIRKQKYSPAPTSDANISTLQESEVPREFFRDSTDFPQHSPPEENHLSAETAVDHDERSNLGDDIKLLMQLLQLSDSGEHINRVDLFNMGRHDGFYRKIPGLKGHKSLKELERLEGWIKHSLNERRENHLYWPICYWLNLLYGIQVITVMDLEALNSLLPLMRS